MVNLEKEGSQSDNTFYRVLHDVLHIIDTAESDDDEALRKVITN